jgi:hypothetical protein
MKTLPMAFFVLFVAFTLPLLSSGCEINTCDGPECRRALPDTQCSVGIVDDAGAYAPDAFEWVVDASGADASSIDAPVDSARSDAADAASDTGAPGACHVNGDCAINEDCVGGTCLTRCRASCQCRVGEACMQGYCTAGQPVPQSCATDCDCLAGQSCIAQVCQ